MIAYALRQLCPHKRNYPTYDFELTAVTIASKKWHHYLYKTSSERIIVSNVAEFSLVSEIKEKQYVNHIFSSIEEECTTKFDKGI